MAYQLDDKLVIGISSRALFDLSEADAIFKHDGLAAYREHQRAHEDVALAPGTGFRLVRALLHINRLASKRLVEVIVMSRNDADSAVRIFRSAEAHGLDVTRGALTGGHDPWPYLGPFSANLFLSAEPGDVVAALAGGFPAALVLAPPEAAEDEPETGVRIAFDGDAVLFDDEAERIYQREGIEAFDRHEVEQKDVPMNPGPFRPFFAALVRIQREFPDGQSPIRTALVTSRGAPAHERVVNTFRSWGLQTNEAFFLGGLDKAGVLEVFRPHIFFDDQLTHLTATSARVPVAHVIPTYEQRELFTPEQVPVVPKAGKKGPTARATASAPSARRPPARQRAKPPRAVEAGSPARPESGGAAEPQRAEVAVSKSG